MNRIILSIALQLLTTAHLIYAQSITNVQAKVAGDTIVVSYMLQSSNGVEITLYVSEDGGRTFGGPLQNVRGDVGAGIQQGSRHILWDVLKEREYVHCSNMVFRVKAVSPFGTFCDSRDGKTYKTVKIGKQVWMAENLAYAPSSGNYWAYHNNSSNVAKYGYLYDWQTSKNVCPTGWHLPTDEEWQELIDFAGGDDDAGTKLKAKNGWSNNGNGTDDYGFSALPGGVRNSDGNFNYVGNYGGWWSSTEYDTDNAWDRGMYYSDSDVGRYDYIKGWGFSVRCVRDL